MMHERLDKPSKLCKAQCKIAEKAVRYSKRTPLFLTYSIYLMIGQSVYDINQHISEDSTNASANNLNLKLSCQDDSKRVQRSSKFRIKLTSASESSQFQPNELPSVLSYNEADQLPLNLWPSACIGAHKSWEGICSMAVLSIFMCKFWIIQPCDDFQPYQIETQQKIRALFRLFLQY